MRARMGRSVGNAKRDEDGEVESGIRSAANRTWNGGEVGRTCQ